VVELTAVRGFISILGGKGGEKIESASVQNID
jgi:hypothetical protein